MTRSRRRLHDALAPLRGDGRGWVLLTVATGWLFTLGLRFLVPTLLPQVKTTFALDNAAAGFAVTVIWGCYALMQFPAGLLTDRVGERTVLATSLALSAGSLALLAAAPLFAVFLLAAAAFGVGSGLYGPARGTSLSKAFPDNDGAAFGITLAAGSVGSAVIPLVAGTAVGALGWRLLVGGTTPAFVAVAALAWVTLPEPIGATRSDGGSTPVPGPSAVEAVRRLPRALRDRNVLLASLAIMFYLFAFQGLTAFLPTYLVAHEGIGQGVAGPIFALLFVGGAVCQLGVGTAADRYGARPVLVAVAALAVVTLLVVPVVDGRLAWATLVFLLGTRMAIAPVTNAYVVARLPDDVQGAAWGFLRTCLFLVGSTGSLFVGAMADAGRFDAAFLALGGVTAVAVVCYAGLVPGQ
ncbi:MFS transporter [Haloplanus rubicundus]|uniref:MFS transporter n=1 Tax=Haloplanus rubicundus TaxID=1547898 RepID=A0A345ECB4_9EURY|nr:MFS transporter [Haloplanus rubicundus]AXG09836.1 MFS transporter [Haloplanus rubicundus]